MYGILHQFMFSYVNWLSRFDGQIIQDDSLKITTFLHEIGKNSFYEKNGKSY